MLDRDAREREVLALLDRWPWELGGVVIGGYALAAYHRPRYSVDVDVVIPTVALKTVVARLQQEGFVEERSWMSNALNFVEGTMRFRRGTITPDLLVGAVRDRDARIDIPEAWISERARKVILTTLAGHTESRVPIVRPEALWALKLQAGRDQDITDLFSIMQTRCDASEVRELFERMRTPSLDSKLAATLAKMANQRLFEDSLSRLGHKRTEEGRSRWDRFTSFASSMVPV